MKLNEITTERKAQLEVDYQAQAKTAVFTGLCFTDYPVLGTTFKRGKSTLRTIGFNPKNHGIVTANVRTGTVKILAEDVFLICVNNSIMGY